jgi:very-short-patch-repair endonuclease
MITRFSDARESYLELFAEAIKRLHSFGFTNAAGIPYGAGANIETLEEYFTNLFETECIPLIKQFAVHSYHLDFCDPDKKVDIEIDGDQHYLDKRIVEHDKIRNQFLEDDGWTIFRIRWSDYKKMTCEEKESIIKQIKELLN